jgi:hypothetical protein
MADPQKFERPFPALTPEQRYYLDVYGYVVVPNTLTADEVGTLKDVLQKLKRDLKALPDGGRVNGATMRGDRAYHHYLVSIIEAHPAITAYCTHPRLVAMAEELIGGEARICEVGAIINSKNPKTCNEAPNYGLHNGTDIPFGSHIKNGLYHCNFVKTLTNLTDLGPDDGGTVVIPGSHKIDAPMGDVIKTAYKDPRLIHQVIAPAGSTLLFSETLIHGTGQIRSDNERTIIICGYASSTFPYWDDGKMSDEFLARIPECQKTLFLGKKHWTRGPKYRTLDQPADDRAYQSVPLKNLECVEASK